MLMKPQVSSSICGQGELTGPTPLCHGLEEYMQELFLISKTINIRLETKT
jgi:hypothetical protein